MRCTAHSTPAAHRAKETELVCTQRWLLCENQRSMRQCNGQCNGAIVNATVQASNGQCNGQCNGAMVNATVQASNGQCNGAMVNATMQWSMQWCNGQCNGAMVNAMVNATVQWSMQWCKPCKCWGRSIVHQHTSRSTAVDMSSHCSTCLCSPAIMRHSSQYYQLLLSAHAIMLLFTVYMQLSHCRNTDDCIHCTAQQPMSRSLTRFTLHHMLQWVAYFLVH